MLKRLKEFTADHYDIHELVDLSAYARSLRQEYETLGVEVPDDIEFQIKAIRREIKAKQSDAVAAELQRVELELKGLQSREEKRSELEKKAARLREMATTAV